MIYPLTPLGEVLQERKETPQPEALESGDVQIISKIGFNDGKIQLRSDGVTKTGMILIRPGDFVVSGINAAKGAIAIYGGENTKSIAATIHYGAYFPNNDKVDIRYLWWLLRSRTFKELLLEYVPGGIKTELKAKRLLPIPVPMPLLPEQRRIVARIEKFVTFIAEARNLHLKAVQLADESMEQFIEHSLSSLPIDGTLGDVIVSRPRSGPSFVTNSDWSGASVLMPSSVTDFGVNMSKIEHGIGDERISPKDRLKEGDILIARGNKRDQVGNAGVVPKEANNYVCANLLMKMRLDENRADNNFCIYWLRSPTMRRYVSEHMNGTNPNIQKINQRTILGFPYATSTSVTHQRSIVVYLDNLQAKADALQLLQKETTIELDALLPSILDKAFKGKLN